MSETDIKSELKALGSELASALKQIRASAEMAALKRDLIASAKKVAADVAHAVKSAKASPTTAKLKTHLGRVAKAGTKRGAAELSKASRVAVKKIGVARRKLVALAKRAKAKRENGSRHG